MGKKTTQFINQIQGELDEMRQSLETLVGIAIRYTELRDELGKLNEEVQEVDERYMPKGNQGDPRFGSKRDYEGELARDPDKKRLDAKMDKVSAELLDTREWMIDTRQNLKKQQDALNGTVKKFEQFVDAKKASWLGSKKSVPEAERFIRNAKEASRSVGEVVSTLPRG